MNAALIVCTSGSGNAFGTTVRVEVDGKTCLDVVRELLPALRTGIMIALWSDDHKHYWTLHTEDVRSVTFPLVSEPVEASS